MVAAATSRVPFTELGEERDARHAGERRGRTGGEAPHPSSKSFTAATSRSSALAERPSSFSATSSRSFRTTARARTPRDTAKEVYRGNSNEEPRQERDNDVMGTSVRNAPGRGKL